MKMHRMKLQKVMKRTKKTNKNQKISTFVNYIIKAAADNYSGAVFIYYQKNVQTAR